MIAETGTMGDELLVTDLVTRARNGDRQAWDALVERYAPLVWSICRRHRLGAAEASDVGQTVWLRLVDELATVRDQADAARLARHGDAAGMRPGPAGSGEAAGCGVHAGRRGHPGRVSRDGGA